ncbi:hypothetical protein HDV05_002805 [Chytridiales sp. JEL 0842]|nr:hypothetical protein HDV05_002805 [Chytridiales sp. JEL 0842]
MEALAPNIKRDDLLQASFIDGFCIFWAQVIELCTSVNNADAMTRQEIDSLTMLFTTTDTRYYLILSDEASMFALLEAAGLLQYVETMRMNIRNDLPYILETFWSASLDRRIYEHVVSSVTATAANNNNSSSPSSSPTNTKASKELPLPGSKTMTTKLSPETPAESVFKKYYNNFTGMISSYSKSTALFLAKQYVQRSGTTIKDIIPDFEPLLISLAKTIRYVFTHKVVITDYVDIKQVLLHPQLGLRIEMFPESLQMLFEYGILGYFKDAGLENAGRIVGGMLRMKSEDRQDPLKLLMAVFDRCGPAMQKLMQMLGNEAKNPNLERFMDRLKDQIEPMNDEERNSCIQSAFGGFNVPAIGTIPQPDGKSKQVNVKLLSLTKRVGSASIGEGWMGEIEQTVTNKHNETLTFKRTVFIKMMRWNVRRRMETDIRFLEILGERHSIIQRPVAELVKGLRQELDWDKEVLNQVKGKRYYQRSNGEGKAAFYDGLYVPEIIGLFTNNSPNYPSACILMEVAAGFTIQSVLNSQYLPPSHASALASVYVNFIMTWCQTMIRQSQRFSHGDPHAGNILVMFNPLNVNYTYLSVLDWGNIVEITEETRRKIIRFSIGLFTGDVSTILDGLGRTQSNRKDPKWVAFKQDLMDIFDVASQLRHLRNRYYKRGTNTYTGALPSDLLGEKAPKDEFSILSPYVQRQIVAADKWGIKDRIFDFSTQVIAAAVQREIELPDGLVGLFRCLKFMDTTFKKIKALPSFKMSNSPVANLTTADVFAAGIMHPKNLDMVMVGSAMENAVLGATRLARRQLKRMLRINNSVGSGSSVSGSSVSGRKNSYHSKGSSACSDSDDGEWGHDEVFSDEGEWYDAVEFGIEDDD